IFSHENGMYGSSRIANERTAFTETYNVVFALFLFAQGAFAWKYWFMKLLYFRILLSALSIWLAANKSPISWTAPASSFSSESSTSEGSGTLPLNDFCVNDNALLTKLPTLAMSSLFILS